MSDTKLSTQEASFIQALAARGGSAGNISLRAELEWSEEAYERIRSGLIEAGFIRAGRGRGGSVILAERVKHAIEGSDDKPTQEGASKKNHKASATKRGKTANAKSDAHLGFEAELFKAADKLRGNMEPSDYKHVALGLIFLKYISDAFEARHAELLADDPQAAEDRDEYLADNIFWVPKDARWSHLQAHAKRPEIGNFIDDAMRAIEKSNESLKGVLPKDYARPALNKVMLGELIDLISGIALGEGDSPSRDVLGRVYEYFLAQFAGSEGKRGGEFYTPRSVVRVLVEMLEPYHGRVYDPCCGSGGMFVQSDKFVREHGGRIGDIAIYGQESNYTTWRLAKMNLAVRGIDADIRWNNEGSFHKDELRDLRFDHILANPPFNISDWGGDRLREDPRWQFGVPPVGNANYAWLQHILWHLAPYGTAGVVLANGSMSSNQSGEGDIRKAMVEADAVDCMVALPGQFFYSTQIPACLWFLARDKSNGKRGKATLRDRRGEVLFIDARNWARWWTAPGANSATPTSRRSPTPTMPGGGEKDAGQVRGRAWLLQERSLEDIRKHGHVLTPGRYVGAADRRTMASRSRTRCGGSVSSGVSSKRRRRG